MADTNYDGYNRVLIEESVGRKNLGVIDWRPGRPSGDGWGPVRVHVNAAGYQARAEALARALRGCGNPEEAPDAAASAASLDLGGAVRRVLTLLDVLTALLDAREPDAEAAAELGDALGLHVQGVATAELAETSRVQRAAGGRAARARRRTSRNRRVR